MSSAHTRRSAANDVSSDTLLRMMSASNSVLQRPTHGILPEMRWPSEWMVMTEPWNASPNSSRIARRRSATVLLVSEMTRIDEGSAPSSRSLDTRPINVVVFPVPAPARTSLVGSSPEMASICCSLSGLPLTFTLPPAMRRGFTPSI